MLEFIQILKQRYQTVLALFDARSPLLAEYEQRVEQLIYAEAYIRKGQLLDTSHQFPLQIAVIGPTQAGKSSIVNLLLNNDLAGVSPLAGYTVHPHGFCNETGINENVGLQNYFGRFQQLAEHQLSTSRHDCYSLTENPLESPLLPSCVLWDTPDFDSIDAADYKEGVIRTIALADMIVLVVSKEKYADQSVWEMMKIIETFHQPTLICVNKLTEGSEQLIIPSLKEKWLQVRHDAFPEVVPLFFQKQRGAPVWPQSSSEIFFDLQKKVTPGKQRLYQQQLLMNYWESWLEPVYAELDAAKSWQQFIDQSLEKALKDYKRDYLNHPHHYQTFQDALVELLNLLEIPGVAKLLGKTRRIMTWPVRKLVGLGKRKTTDGVAQEVSLLNQIGDHVVIRLTDHIMENSDSDSANAEWWKDAGSVLRQQKNKIIQRYQLEVEQYHTEFQQDVDATAKRLYHKLEEQPVVLNTLRATRATTDATAMAMAIYAGGIGLHDLVITPAMLSVTSLLAESAVGSYMNRVESELKQHQLETVKTRLFEDNLKFALYLIPQQLPAHKRFNISSQQLEQAEQLLNEKKHGLRIL